jgi:hypothetical protein
MLSLFRRSKINKQGMTLIEIAAITLLTASAGLQILSAIGPGAN